MVNNSFQRTSPKLSYLAISYIHFFDQSFQNLYSARRFYEYPLRTRSWLFLSYRRNGQILSKDFAGMMHGAAVADRGARVERYGRTQPNSNKTQIWFGTLQNVGVRVVQLIVSALKAKLVGCPSKPRALYPRPMSARLRQCVHGSRVRYKSGNSLNESWPFGN